MKKLVIKIGNETHELPYNGEVFSFEVSEKYVPKVGDCVMVDPKESGIFYWCKITETTEKLAYFDIVINSKLEVSKKGFFNISDNRVYIFGIKTSSFGGNKLYFLFPFRVLFCGL